MAWLVKYAGEEFTTEDLTLDELAAMETATGVAYNYLNPERTADVAKAFLALALVKSGVADDVAKKQVGGLTKREIKGAFTEVDDEADLPTQYDDGIPDPKAAPAPTTS